MNIKPLLLLAVLLGSPWLWRIISFNGLVGAITVGATIFLLFPSRWFYLLFLFLLIFQLQTTSIVFPWEQDVLGVQLTQQRLNEYPPITWLPVAHWLDGRVEAISFYKLTKNFFEVLDLNHYFFAGHPRPIPAAAEFQKFSYILLPFFLLGVIKNGLAGKKFFVCLALPLVIFSTVGSKNHLGEFSLFPFIAVTITGGLAYVVSLISSTRHFKYYVLFFGVVFILSLVQIWAYVKY